MNEPVTIPPEAIEAAAEAHYRWVFGDAVWSEENDGTKNDFRHEARAALEAALPAILAAERERIAKAIAALPSPPLHDWPGGGAQIRQAAALKIVRAES